MTIYVLDHWDKLFPWKCDFEKPAVKFPIPIALDMTGCRKCIIFFFGGGAGKCLKNSQKLHGGDRKHIKVCKKKSLKIDGFFTSMPAVISISQNKPVQLVPCFVRVDHKCVGVRRDVHSNMHFIVDIRNEILKVKSTILFLEIYKLAESKFSIIRKNLC